MKKQYTMNFEKEDIEKLKQLTGATTMNGAVEIAIQHTIDSYRKDLDYDMVQFVEGVVKERMKHYTDDILSQLKIIENEFEQLYISEGSIVDAVEELKLIISGK